MRNGRDKKALKAYMQHEYPQGLARQQLEFAWERAVLGLSNLLAIAEPDWQSKNLGVTKCNEKPVQI